MLQLQLSLVLIDLPYRYFSRLCMLCANICSKKALIKRFQSKHSHSICDGIAAACKIDEGRKYSFNWTQTLYEAFAPFWHIRTNSTWIYNTMWTILLHFGRLRVELWKRVLDWFPRSRYRNIWHEKIDLYCRHKSICTCHQEQSM